MKGLSLGLSLTGSTGAAPAAFDPASLGASLDAWWDVSDLSTLYSDLAGTTPAAVDGPVGYIADKSADGRHLAAPTNAHRGTLRQAGSVYYIEALTGTRYQTAGGQTWPALSDIFLGIRNVGFTQWVSLYRLEADTDFLGLAQSGNASATHDNSGTPADYVDGVAISPTTRDGLYDAIGDGADKVLGIYNAALANFTTAKLFQYGAGFNFNGHFHGGIITAANAGRADVTDYLMGEQGR
jgi:hypothetical protein